ncbi:MAG: ABC transporter, substrate-binding protein (cluster 8, B12/iron complex) [Nitrospira sp.]|jgi:iron complex transport system substrate-binding protein|nr:MAG: ABC transporter, substrate-binding protein (cluster 8, B12/iron complex) [Nitrospira sp.]
MRICSLVPGATEIVAALGLQQDLVGISHECDSPPGLAQVPVMVRPRIEGWQLSSAQIDEQVGALLSDGTALYELDEPRLLAAQPDIIIAQDLCDVCAVTPSQLDRVIRTLSPEPRMVTLNPQRLDDILQDIVTLGRTLEQEGTGVRFAAALRGRLEAVRTKIASEAVRPRVACLEWLSPLYTAGHWVPDMVDAAGGLDVLATAGTASRKVDWITLFASAPEVIVLMPCGFTVERTRAELATVTEQPQWKDLPAVRRGAVYLVDALSYFSRPGPRLIDGVEQLAAIFHPAYFGHRLPSAVERLEGQTPLLH